ncbi:MAG TPA: hypothetical protein VHV77_07100 [Pirellulales bacterium]|nr:hypothetical protein [Pirellulales bacterium]
MSPSREHQPVWFPAKRYGWGWGLPVAWQGWIVLILWFVAFTPGAAILALHTWVGFGVFVVLMTALLFAVCYAKGERPRWRWGK